MGPERKIERWLRAFARKRRAGAGDFTLHPATRRRLQEEAARRAREADDDEGSVSLFQLFRRDWAFLVGFGLVIFFFATLMLPSLAASKKKAKAAVAMSNLKQIGLAARTAADENGGRLPENLGLLTNGFLARDVLNDPQSGRQFVYVAGGKELDGLSTNAVLAYAPEGKTHAILYADGRVGTADDEQLAALTGERAAMVERREVAGQRAAKEQAQNAISPRGSGSVNGGELTVSSMLNLSSAMPLKFTNTATMTVGVLRNFQWQQDGAAIVVHDQDGSVYAGYWSAQNKSDFNGNVSGLADHSFRLAGTNQTLGQIVIIDGRVASGTNGPVGGRIDAGLVASNVDTQLPPFRILGTATAGTNRIEIDARPAR